MALSANQLSLLFKAKGDTDDAKRAFDSLEKSIDRDTKKIKRDVGDMDNAVQKGGLSFSKLAGPAAIASAGIAAVAAIAVQAGRAIFDLTNTTAKYLQSIEDAAERTGLMAETLSALRFGADAFGADFGQMEKAVAKFARIVGDAATGSTEAKEALERLGLDPQEAIDDLDGALGKVFKRIIDLPPGVEQMNAAIDAFGRSGTDLLPFLVDFDGDLEGLIEKARSLGLVFDRETVRAADRFRDTMGTVQSQLLGVGYTIGNELIPTFQRLAETSSELLRKNQDNVAGWAQRVGDFIDGTVSGIENLLKALERLNEWVPVGSVARYIALATPGGAAIAAIESRGARDRESRERYQASGELSIIEPRSSSYLSDEKTEAENRAKEREQIARRDSAAQIKILQDQLAAAESAFQRSFEKLRDSFKETGDAEGFNQAFQQALIDFGTEISKIEPMLSSLETSAARTAKSTATELQLLAAQQSKRIEDLTDKSLKIQMDAERLVTESVKKESEDRQKLSLEQLQFQLSQEERNVQARQAFLDRQRAADLISEEAYQAARQNLTLDYTSATEQNGRLIQIDMAESFLNFKRANLQAQLELVKGNAEKENEIKKQISELNTQIEVEYFNQSKERAEAAAKSAREQIELEKELLEIKRSIVTEERRLADFRADQERKRLENEAEFLFGKKRLEALERLRVFEIAEAQRRFLQIQNDIFAEEAAALKAVEGKENEEAQKKAIEDLYRERRLISEEEFQIRLAEIRAKFSPRGSESGLSGLGTAIQEGVAGIFGDSTEQLELFAGLADIVSTSFNQMAQAVGNSVRAFVLFGSAGGSFRKFAAEMLATIAQMAAVQAVWNLAEGFAKLALAFFGHPTAGASATQHFIAAAVYGSVAGVAAIAGRAVAGNSFASQQTGSAYGGSTPSGGGGQGQSTSGAYSSQEDQTVDAGRNSPFAPQITIVAKGDFADWLKFQVETNTQTGRMIREGR